MSVGVLEKATAQTTHLAAAELDNFCCAKIWTRTILAEGPKWAVCAKRGLMFSSTPTDIDLLRL